MAALIALSSGVMNLPYDHQDTTSEKSEREEQGFSLLPQPLPWAEFDKREFPEQRWRIRDLVPLEGFVIIAAPSGEKKTWLSMAMAKAIADGSDFLGNEEFRAVIGNVLYIDQEMAQSEIQRRGRLLGLNKTNSWLFSQTELNLSDEMYVDSGVRTYNKTASSWAALNHSHLFGFRARTTFPFTPGSWPAMYPSERTYVRERVVHGCGGGT